MRYNKYKVSAKSERTYNNIVFASKKEMNRYKELLLLEKSGIISNLSFQPKYILQEPFVNSEGLYQRAIYYIGDFEYYDKGKLIVEDVKGIKTQIYLLKKKMFLYKYPNIIFKEV